MTVGTAGIHPGELLEVTGEEPQPDGSEIVSFKIQHGKISADLTTGADVASVVPTRKQTKAWLRAAFRPSAKTLWFRKRKLKNGLLADKKCRRFLRPLVACISSSPREVWVIDFFGVSQDEAMKFSPTVYQHLLVNVKPERDQSQRASDQLVCEIVSRFATNASPHDCGLGSWIVLLVMFYIVFFFLVRKYLPYQLNVFAFDDAFYLGVLSSRIHVVCSLAAGGRLGVGNDPR